jgi:regulator of nucleoside diphosphate kinase
MKSREIYITSFDHSRLSALLSPDALQTSKDKAHLLQLKKELERALLVEPADVPADVVTMNSKTRIRDLETGEILEYTLVFPRDADIRLNKISILAPIGTALLGYRVGDVIEWTVPGGVRVLKVEAVLYQPESAGDFHL